MPLYEDIKKLAKSDKPENKDDSQEIIILTKYKH
jgi:hypothetical protein